MPVPASPTTGISDAAWEQARERAKIQVDKEREHEADLDAIRKSRGGREKSEARHERIAGYAKWIPGQLAHAGQAVGTAAIGAAAGARGGYLAPAAMAGIELASTALSKLGPYGMAAGAALQAVGKVGLAASETVAAFVARGRELSGYSGQLAGATAQADVRSMVADIREAQELGPQLAAMIDNQSKLETSFRELLLPIKEWLLGFLNEGINFTLKALPDVLELLNGILQGVTLGTGRSASIDRTIKRIRDIIDKAPEADPLIDIFLKAADGFKAPMMPAPQVIGGGALGIPIVGIMDRGVVKP